MEILENNKRKIKFLSDLEINLNDSELDDLELQLSKEEEQILEEIASLQKRISNHPTFMQDMLKAVEQGSINFIDSITDTGDSFNELKDPKSVRQLNDIEIDKKYKSADPEKNRNWQTRTMKAAKEDPIDLNAANSTTGMSDIGIAKFKRYKEAYSQRTKSITKISNKDSTINYKTDERQNFESLSGLRNYRVGPVVPMPSVQEMKMKFQQAVNDGKIDQSNRSGFIRDENFAVFDKQLMKEFGFKSPKDAEKWRVENHLTIHEGPDGMFLVPTDVHDATSHSGYVSKLAEVLAGKDGAEEALKKFKIEEKKRYIEHEVKNRSIRVIKGVGLSAVKDLLKHSVVIICKETYIEFKEEHKDSLIERIKRILQKCWSSLKAKIKYVFSNIWNNIKGSILSEFLTALNDFIFGTFKNIFKVVRQMWGSIKSAFNIICNTNSSWEDRIFEASKILSAGIVGIIGFSLNELIEKGLMSIGIPFSSFISECVSGLFAGILSAVVLMIFDHAKEYLQCQDEKLQLALLQSKSLTIDVARISISSIKIDKKMYETFCFFADSYIHIERSRNSIINNQDEISSLIAETKTYLLEEKEQMNRLKELLENGKEF